MAAAKRVAILFEPDEGLRAGYAEVLGKAGWHCQIVSSLQELVEQEFAAWPHVAFIERESDGNFCSRMVHFCQYSPLT